MKLNDLISGDMWAKSTILIILVVKTVCCVDLVCDPNTGTNCECTEEPCFRKCCKFTEIYEEGTCVKRNHTSPESLVIKLHNDQDFESEYSFRTIRTFVFGIPCCDNSVKPYFSKSGNFKLFTNASLLLTPRKNSKNWDDYAMLNAKHYCADFISENSSELFVSYCFPDEFEQLSSYVYYSSFCLLVSIPFLVVTEIVFLLLEGFSNNLPGKITISQIFALTVSFIILADIRFIVLSSYLPVCRVFGHLLQYSILANFFWLNVMCFDIWLVFSGLSMPYRNLSKDKEMKKFLRYSMYAWGLPVVICSITYLAELLPKDSPFRPAVGEQFCLIQKNYSKQIFYFLPLTILLILNVSMFSATAYKIYKHKKEMSVLKSDGNNVNNNVMEKERLKLYFKLFLVMGITWVAEPLSDLFDEEPEWLWTTLDSINLLQGIPIFIIFVCKRRTLRSISKKLCPSRQLFTTESSARRESSNVQSPKSITQSTGSTSNTTIRNTNSIRNNKNSDFEMVPTESTSKSYDVVQEA